ncbi:MBL fold metallo-hydrolase [Microbacterium soli]|uniref:MBL fold metallo-hydrolase n=1 Tax=Microbacterium soli TaxID=446075 RepID=A0ABP7MQD1_9MICO
MSESLTITRVAHSCHLIQIGDRTILTDPWFSERVFYHPGEPVALTPETLPRLDAVLISHEHYDHCDLRAFRGYRDHDVPMIVAGPVARRARRAGFTDITPLDAWQSAQIGDITVHAAPGLHGVHEVTFIIEAGGRSVYFAGDTLLTPDLLTLSDRHGTFDVALLPINGLTIRTARNRQVVMNADEAAELAAALHPKLVVPQHYAYTAGPIGDRLILRSDKDPALFANAMRQLAPTVPVAIIDTGSPLHVTP